MVCQYFRPLFYSNFGIKILTVKLNITSILYKSFLKKIFFFFDAELAHEFVLNSGSFLGKNKILNSFLKNIYSHKYFNLEQKIAGIYFENPVGLAAGFDYEAKLTQIFSSLGFGYATLGTITNEPYTGNPKPRLARLPKSKSLMVYKGFKNEGASKISQKLQNRKFDLPVGISIGRTNSPKLKTQKESISDIITAFKTFENANINHFYYELNISCPNLLSEDIEFYTSKNLGELLNAVDKLSIKKPIFIKMPINKSNKESLKMLKVIASHKIAGVIFGNLQKDRTQALLDKEEIKKFNKGNFSGKPTEKRSNELIALAYRHFGNKLLIIGCGGIFSAKDAYRKIKLGANLVQLITGLIYEGPQLVSQINRELSLMLKKDGYKNINQAVGTASK